MEGDTESWESFELERLLNRRIIRRGRNATPTTQYLARWKGYGPQYDTWLSLKELGNAGDLIKEYDEAYPHIDMAKATTRRKDKDRIKASGVLADGQKASRGGK